MSIWSKQRKETKIVLLAVSLLGCHVLGMFLAGFSRGQIPYLTKFVTFVGFVAIPLCSWLVSRSIDRRVERLPLRDSIKALVRICVAACFIGLLPSFFHVLQDLPLPLISRTLELVTAVVSIAMVSGMVMLGLGVADLIYRLTSRVTHLATRMMLLLLMAAFGTFLWLSFLGYQSEVIIHWALQQGHLDVYLKETAVFEKIASSYVGTLAGALSLELPFILLLAWRFGHNATKGLGELRRGFDRVARGNLQQPVKVNGHDEIANMQHGFNDMLVATRERQFLETAFGQYVSPLILARLRNVPAREQWIGERLQATVLFSDIRGFTSMSAKLPPEAVIDLLNDYMSIMIDTVATYEGYINKFVGDAIMVIWNTPVVAADHPLRALACAAAMQEALAAANREGRFGKQQVEMGIGVNTGTLVAGNLGNKQQVEFTVIGDTVNVASRACSKAAPGQVALTQQTLQAAKECAASAQPVLVTSLGQVDLKGKGPTELFALDTSAKKLWQLLNSIAAETKRSASAPSAP